MPETHAEPLRPQFFLVRPDNRMVPLIAVDELPSYVRISGAPPSLTVLDLTGMTSLGQVQPRHRQYEVEGVYSSQPTRLAAENTIKNDLSGKNLSDPAPNGPRSNMVTPARAYSIDVPPQPAPAATASDNDPIDGDGKDNVKKNTSKANDTASPVEGSKPAHVPGTKTHCTFWMRTGQCDFIQQGCIYKHEMPTTAEELAQYGFSDRPNWYRQKYQLPSLRLAPGMDIPSFSLDDAKHNGPWWRTTRPAVADGSFRVGLNSRDARSGARRYFGRWRVGEYDSGYDSTDKPVSRPRYNKELNAKERDAIARRQEEYRSAAIARDKIEDKRRKELETKHPILGPATGSILKHDPKCDGRWESEDECTDRMTDMDKYERMTREEFDREVISRRDRALAEEKAASADSDKSNSGKGKGRKSPRGRAAVPKGRKA